MIAHKHCINIAQIRIKKTSLLGYFIVASIILSSFTYSQRMDYGKHNFSVIGGTVSAQENIGGANCKFCHVSHLTGPRLQAWNSLQNNRPATLYSSDYLTSLNYDKPTGIKQRTKLCLTCHDGTVAIGKIYNLPGLGNDMVQEAYLTASNRGYLGTDLTDDHPVGYLYNPSKDPELQPVALINPNIKLDPNNNDKNSTIECLTCHDAHNNQFPPLLKMSNANSELCKTCHAKKDFDNSIHGSSKNIYVTQEGETTTIGQYGCKSCHTAHSGKGKPYLLVNVEQHTCYNGTNTGCHGVNATEKNNRIEPLMEKSSRHPTNYIEGKHKNKYGGEEQVDLQDFNRHAECQDCHNPHQAETTVPKEKQGNVKKSAALKGVWGVEPIWTSAPSSMNDNSIVFALPQGYRKIADAEYEYQVCLKCHSNYIDLSGKRNIAEEINPNNSSYHGIVPDRTKSNSHVTSQTLMAPWNTPERNVWCSDCHGNDDPTGPQGPHGSDTQGSFDGGGGISNTDKMLVATIASNENIGTPLCLQCHKTSVYWNTSGSSDNILSRFQYHGNNGTANHGANSGLSDGCFTCHMLDRSVNPTAGKTTNKIYAHGWNKKWVYNSSTLQNGIQGSGQMVDAFLGWKIGNHRVDSPTSATCWSACHGNQNPKAY